MIKKILSLALILSTSHVFANNITVRASEMANSRVETWEIATVEDGYFQILGPSDHKKFIVSVSSFHNGKPSDPLTISCNAGGMYQTHLVAPGATIECIPDFKDVIPMYVENFHNGSQGTFRYEPYNTSK